MQAKMGEKIIRPVETLKTTLKFYPFHNSFMKNDIVLN